MEGVELLQQGYPQVGKDPLVMARCPRHLEVFRLRLARCQMVRRIRVPM